MKFFLLCIAFSVLLCANAYAGVTPVIPQQPHSDKLAFKENKGQWYSAVKYLGEIPGGNIFLEQQGFTYELVNGDDISRMHPCAEPITIHGHVYKVDFLGSNINSTFTTENKSVTYYNYFLGKDASHWAPDVHAYDAVTYHSLYPGIDMKVYGQNYTLKYDLTVHAGGNTSAIQFKYRGMDKLYLHNENLIIQTSIGEIVEVKPYAYQLIGGERQEVACKYVLSSNHVLSFTFPNGFNTGADLVIDPQLIFSTYTGSKADNWGWTATYDDQGNLYLGGYVNELNNRNENTGVYPTTTGAFQVTWKGGSGGGNGGIGGKGIGYACDMGISKFNSTGTTLLYSTYLGGSDNECPHSLFVNSLNQLCVYGETYSSDYPVTAGAYDATYNGNGDIAVTVFNTTGTALIGSTYIGGTGSDAINHDPTESGHGNLKVNYGDNARGEIICDKQNNIYVATSTSSADFPTTKGCYQSAIGGQQDGCVLKLNNTCSNLIYSTFLGGSLDDAAYSIDLASDNSLYIAGGTMSTNFPSANNGVNKTYLGGFDDGYVVHLNAAGTALLNSTFVGTAANDQTYCVKLDVSGNVYVTGNTNGHYPVSAGVYSNPNSGQYITKFNSTLSDTIYSTVFGNGNGQPNISPTAFLVDTCENVYVAGWGNSANTLFSAWGFQTRDMTNLPLTPDAYQSTTDGTDFYIIVLKKDAKKLLYATYFGGNGAEEHVDGGTSRFDKNGVIYEAICASCGGYGKSFPVVDGGTPTSSNAVWSPTNQSDNCNELGLKMDMNFVAVHARALADPAAIGCQPLNVQFVNNSLHAVNYFWNFGTGKAGDTSHQFQPAFTFNDTGTYKVMLVASNPNSCRVYDTTYTSVVVFNTVIKAGLKSSVINLCDSVQAYLTGMSNGRATKYSWNFGDGTSSTKINPEHTFTKPGTYKIVLTIKDSLSCNVLDTSNLSVTVPPSVHGTIPDTAYFGCPPFQVDFKPDYIDVDSIKWNFGDGTTSTLQTPSHTFPDPGNYRVTLITTNHQTCNKYDTSISFIHVKTPIKISLIASSTDNCDSVIVHLSATSTGTATNYYLNFDDSTYSTSPNQQTHVYHKPGSYQIILYTHDSLACNPYDTLTYTTNVRPRVSAQLLNPYDSGCAPLTVNFNASIENADTISWDFGDGESSSSATPTHIYPDAGIYPVFVVALNSVLCNHSDSAFGRVIVYPASPKAKFEAVPNTVKLGTPIIFINHTIGGDTYKWQFGDGDSATTYNVEHNYLRSGNYTACLTVNYNEHCPDSTCMPLRVEPPQVIDVPNAFTPNGDHENDILYVRGEGITTLLFKLFNRWGEKIFETNDLNVGWDGTYKGKPQEMDVYTWELFATFVDGSKVQRSGNVTLIR